MRRSLPQLRIAALLGAAAVLATFGVFPYLLALRPDALAHLRVSASIVIVAQALQAGVACLLMAWAGLKLGEPIGLGAPHLAAWLYRDRARRGEPRWLLAAGVGFAAGLIVLAAIRIGGPPLGDSTPQRVAPAWTGLLASPYGGIVEEIASRAFAMGAIAWLLVRAHVPTTLAIGIAIVLAALAFGAGHLPFAAQLAPLTPAIVIRVLAYNGIVGLAFGVVYWRHGLEHAMLAHFCADLVLHVVVPAGI